MATYNSVHLSTANRNAVLESLEDYRRRFDWWKFWRQNRYAVQNSVDGWTEIEINDLSPGARKLTEHLSKDLDCLALTLAHESVTGSQYISVCDKGMTIRALWYSRGESVHQEEGEPLEFEEEVIKRRRAEVERELAEMDPELRAEESEWMLKRT
jgi:hypothetical protein